MMYKFDPRATKNDVIAELTVKNQNGHEKKKLS